MRVHLSMCPKYRRVEISVFIVYTEALLCRAFLYPMITVFLCLTISVFLCLEMRVFNVYTEAFVFLSLPELLR